MANQNSKPPAKAKGQPEETTGIKLDIGMFQNEMRTRRAQIEALLGGSCTYERFEMTAMMALQQNRDLLLCDMKSLFNAFRRAAQLQLLPDGRQGVVTHYNTKNGRMAEFNPMYHGLLAKALNDPAIDRIETNIVRENDEFEFVQGSAPTVTLKRSLRGGGEIIGAYCLITLKGGEQMLEILTYEEGMAIKDQSRGKDNVWKGAFEGEMWRKAVFRRGVKWAPISADVQANIANEDGLLEDIDYTALPAKQHPDNDRVKSQPPNPGIPHHDSTLNDQAMSQISGQTIEGEIVGRGEQQSGGAASKAAVAPDEVLSRFKADLDLASTEGEVQAVLSEWRGAIDDLLPPDVEEANGMVEARRKAISA